jgi:hypothetical protein
VIGLVGTVLVASFLGSAHCAGMCGGFVCFYSGQAGDPPRWYSHLAYNGGRLASYLLLGALAGLVGAGVDRIGAAAGLSRAAAILAGILMVAWGVMTLLLARGIRLPGTGGRWLARSTGAMARRLTGHPPVVRALLLGLLTTLLPCGWLYAFVATAAGTGTVPGAMAVMAVFWLGTVPVLASIGLAAQRGFGPLRRHLPAVTATVMVVLGLLLVTGRAGRMSAAIDHARTMPADAPHARR